MVAGRFKELLKKYGKVGLGVHFSVSAASVTGLYIAVKNNVDVEAILEKVGLPSVGKEKDIKSSDLPSENLETTVDRTAQKERNRTPDLAASSGGALALALLINKALFPVRVPITLALTPPLARFLARRNIFKSGETKRSTYRRLYGFKYKSPWSSKIVQYTFTIHNNDLCHLSFSCFLRRVNTGRMLPLRRDPQAIFEVFLANNLTEGLHSDGIPKGGSTAVIQSVNQMLI